MIDHTPALLKIISSLEMQVISAKSQVASARETLRWSYEALRRDEDLAESFHARALAARAVQVDAYVNRWEVSGDSVQTAEDLKELSASYQKERNAAAVSCRVRAEKLVKDMEVLDLAEAELLRRQSILGLVSSYRGRLS